MVSKYGKPKSRMILPACVASLCSFLGEVKTLTTKTPPTIIAEELCTVGCTIVKIMEKRTPPPPAAVSPFLKLLAHGVVLLLPLMLVCKLCVGHSDALSEASPKLPTLQAYRHLFWLPVDNHRSKIQTAFKWLVLDLPVSGTIDDGFEISLDQMATGSNHNAYNQPYGLPTYWPTHIPGYHLPSYLPVNLTTYTLPSCFLTHQRAKHHICSIICLLSHVLVKNIIYMRPIRLAVYLPTYLPTYLSIYLPTYLPTNSPATSTSPVVLQYIVSNPLPICLPIGSLKASGH